MVVSVILMAKFIVNNIASINSLFQSAAVIIAIVWLSMAAQQITHKLNSLNQHFIIINYYYYY